ISGMKNEITQFQHELSEKIEISYELIDAIVIHDESLRPGIPDEEEGEAAHALLKDRVAGFCNSYSSFKSLFVRFLARADIIV
ncbi:MAG TPA: hypothetical protein VJ647_01145, partial [Chitinophagaceae bacterium]|nr:hypothetical protein [Chitinophagaceae bacterium]